MMPVYRNFFVNEIEVDSENEYIEFDNDPENENLLLQIHTGNVEIIDRTGDAAGEINVEISENAGKLNHFQHFCFLE